jgi:hypothetical protein
MERNEMAVLHEGEGKICLYSTVHTSYRYRRGANEHQEFMHTYMHHIDSPRSGCTFLCWGGGGG